MHLTLYLAICLQSTCGNALFDWPDWKRKQGKSLSKKQTKWCQDWSLHHKERERQKKRREGLVAGQSWIYWLKVSLEIILVLNGSQATFRKNWEGCVTLQRNVTTQDYWSTVLLEDVAGRRTFSTGSLAKLGGKLFICEEQNAPAVNLLM